MSGFRGDDFDDRRKAAAEAKKALMERFKTALPDPNDPALIARREADVAREQREREKSEARKAAKKAEEERLAREKADRIAAAEAAKKAEALRKLELLAEQKRARDARYAARKARVR
jgi:membrane protein involved in colicin uptake